MLDHFWDITETNAFKIILCLFISALMFYGVKPIKCLDSMFGRSAESGTVAVSLPSGASGSSQARGSIAARGLSPSAGPGGSLNSFDYGAIRGPHSWIVPTNNQSPINIEQRRMANIHFETPLEWTNLEIMPAGIRLENNGHTLVLRASYPRCVPSIGGWDLLGRFELREISFRWSWSSNMGSEHTVGNRHYPLEMQCLHTLPQASGIISSQNVLMISYMFEVGQDNPYMDVLTQHLVAIKRAGRSVEVSPFPISYLVTPFYTEFFSYQGSLTQPPCHRGVEWLINPRPLAISERQLNAFRQLRSYQGAHIGCNARPVQPLEDRTVFYNLYRVQQ
ncbi:carbonic anhydrase 2 [Drosophila subobscura]|uniref:carbonic anhydrase 2 n=1 Tax=Drosophila subobscura TaxID=7241 RepID=UPI00155AECAB|nr:carbonic anhydrase 2 [Drosophila subobscura]